jgi:O-antigen/teichoic acid export membrane protein
MMRSIKKFFQGQDTPEGRGQRRIRRASFTSILSFISLGITSAGALISIPLTARYLGIERFGVWLILSTFLAWGSVADLGLANSLTNALATADGQQDREQAKEAVSSAFYLMLGVAGVVMVLLILVAYPLVSWERVFNVSSLQAKAEVGPAILITIFVFVLRLPLSIPRNIYAAYQEGYLSQFWSILSNLLSLAALLIAIQMHASLPLLIGAFFGTALLGDVFNGIHVFGWRRQWLKPRLCNFSWSRARWLLKTGSQFWVAQISAILLFQTDLIIVTQLFGAREVASYGVTLKLFSFIGTVAGVFLSPLWPAYNEALARKDVPWITQTFKRTIFISFSCSLPLGILVFIFCPIIISSWVGQDAIPEQSLLLAMLFTSVITTV